MGNRSISRRRKPYLAGYYTSSNIFSPESTTFYDDVSGPGHSPFGHSPTSWVDSVSFGKNFSDWRLRIAESRSATTSLNGFRITVKSTPARFFRKLGKPAPDSFKEKISYGVAGDLFRISNPSSSDGSSLISADNQAKIRFLNNARSAQVALQGGVVLGELGETLRFLKSTGAGLVHSVGDYLAKMQRHKGRLPKGKRRKFLADKWLEWNYAARPLFSDVEDAFEALSRYQYHPDPYKKVKGRASNLGPATTSSLGFDGFVSTFQWGFRTRTQSTGTVKYYGEVTVTNPGFSDFHSARNLGLDIRSFVPTVWELIPYSFLVDYFTNIGDCISAFSFNQADLRWVARGTLLEDSVTVIDQQFAKDTSSGGYLVTSEGGTPGSKRITRESRTRLDYSAVPLIPSLEFSIPGVTSRKWLNMAALLVAHKKCIPF